MNDRGKRKYGMLGRIDMLEEYRNCEKRLPQAIVIGVMKAGTEAFATFLAINPDIAMSLNVATTLYFASNYKKGLDWYKDQMVCSTSSQVTVEKAPQYFMHSLAPSRIRRMNKYMKIILLVRDPIARAISHYLQAKSAHPKLINNRSFEDIVFTADGGVKKNDFVAFSEYSVTLKRWYKYFDKSQVLILDGDEFKQDQIKVLTEAETFLNVRNYITSDKFIFDENKGFYCVNVNGEAACLSKGKGRTHPTLSPVHYEILKKHFAPYNEEFYKMTGKRYNW
ncbi:Heparan sulfate glucosamine 3-O-sulfotransferase 4 [Mactra antiquata]